MRRRSIVVGLAALPCARTVCSQARLQPWTGDPVAPPVELQTLDGEPLSLAGLRGKVVLVNFWATWCEPCVEEMPSIQRLRERLARRPFEVLGVNHQEGRPRIRTFLDKVPVAFPIVRDTDGGVARAWKVRIFPSSYVVDAQGAIRLQLVGSIDWSSTAVIAQLEPLLQAAGRRG
jgi:thiol-disulfide isomerase/thioredoxin